ncbi:MAG: hypothetical protein GY953_31855, partial [bacterium]|nr:hypothetical protein [bacterium]
SGQWRYTEWLDRDSGEVRAKELYDHANGPIADRNLAGETEHASTVERLSALLAKGDGWRSVREQLA